MATPEMERFVDRILTWMEHPIKTSSALELAVSRLVYLCPDVSNDPGCIQVSIFLS